jgi:hypothetical protein
VPRLAHNAAAIAACRIIATLAKNWLTMMRAHTDDGTQTLSGAESEAGTHESSPGQAPLILKPVEGSGAFGAVAGDVYKLPSPEVKVCELIDTLMIVAFLMLKTIPRIAKISGNTSSAAAFSGSFIAPVDLLPFF